MQEPYKEMYIHLYKTLEALEKASERLAKKIDYCLGQTTDMYVTHLTDLAREDREEIEQQFADLFED